MKGENYEYDLANFIGSLVSRRPASVAAQPQLGLWWQRDSGVAPTPADHWAFAPLVLA